MPGTLQPLSNNLPIVNPNGTPTEYFIRWAQAKQIDLQGAITAEEAFAIVTEFVDNFLQTHVLQEGTGIEITPDGNLANSPTIAANIQTLLDQISTVQGTILFRGAAGWQVLAPGTAGQFLKTNGAGADPSWATGGSGGGASIYAVNPPPAGLSTWVNQGTTTKTVQADGTVTLIAPNDASDNNRGIFMALPATPWNYTIGWIPSLANVSFQWCGIALRESSSGKMVIFTSYQEAGPAPLFFIANYDSPISKNANVIVAAPPTPHPGKPIYLRLADDGTTRTAGFGYDPYYQPFGAYSVAHNSFIVPDQIGIIVDNFNASGPLGISVFSWVG